MRSWARGRGGVAPSTAMRIDVASCSPIQMGTIRPSADKSSMGLSRMTCPPEESRATPATRTCTMSCTSFVSVISV